jgi:hypothetical protein
VRLASAGGLTTLRGGDGADMIAVALGLIALGVLLLFLFPWGGIVLGIVGVVLFLLTLVGWVGRPANRGRTTR